jgi:hypothetical protein
MSALKLARPGNDGQLPGVADFDIAKLYDRIWFGDRLGVHAPQSKD